MKLGEVIREHREQHGLSQREFARRCNLSNVAIAAIENGFRSDGKIVAPKFETIRKIARAMGISTEALIYKCDDFDIDISDDDPVEAFVREAEKQSPDENMLIQAYRLIPAEHRLEAIEAVLKIKAKYEN